MARFQVGDRVRVLTNVIPEGGVHPGDEVTITDIWGEYSGYQVENALGCSDGFYAYQLTAEPDPEQEREQEQDVISHPSHYTRFPVEVIEITEQLDFNRGNAVKYLCRAGAKVGADEMEDLRKSLWYTERAIQKLTKERENGDVASDCGV